MKKKIMALVLVLTMAFSCTGCGEELIPLTDSEREQIVHFSAHIIGEFNKSQTEGYTALNKKQLQAIYSEEDGESSELEEQDSQNDLSGEDASRGQDTAGAESSGVTTTLTKALGIEGIKARCSGYEVQKDYVQDSVFAMTASEGKTYVVLTVKLENTTSSKISCDVAGKKDTFRLNINSGESQAEAQVTFLPNDLGAFCEDIAGGKTKDTILLFEVPEDSVKNISSLSLEIDNGTTKQTILIN